MAKKLTDIYNAAKQEGGLATTMRMAMLTGIPSVQAATMPDSPDLVKKFADVYKELTGKICPIN